MTEIKQEVQQFYDQVGWQLIYDDIYQNARYEDLRPVSHEYIHRCHRRVARYLRPEGQFFLDAGSGPVQYHEYLEYSRNYHYRVCADISLQALKEAQKRVAGHGLYVVADLAHLPFKPETFEGIVSLHTIHHLPEEEHLQAYEELYRVLSPRSTAVVVNGWSTSRLMKFFDPLIRNAQRLRFTLYRRTGRGLYRPENATASKNIHHAIDRDHRKKPKGTFTSRHDVAWIKNEVGAQIPVEIYVWRSVSVRFLRALIHPRLGGRTWLRLLYWLEDRFPRFFGKIGKYPLITMRKN